VIPPAVRQYLLVACGVLGLAAVLTGLTATCYLYNARIDLSPGDRFTLSDHALNVIRGLDQPVRMTGFIRTEDPRNPVLKDLLWQVANESPFVTYSIVDVNRNPAMAAEYDVDAYGSTVVESASRRTEFSNPSESQIVAAILNVTQPPKKVYALTGHGECDLSDPDRVRGCSLMRTALQMEFYEVEDLSLLGNRAVPDDASVVLLVGPRSDPLPGELDKLGRYLAGGGKLLALLDPFTVPKLAAWLQGYGFEVGDDIIIDIDNRLAGSEPLSAAIRDANPRQLITANLGGAPVFSGTRSVGGRSDEQREREATWLLKSGARSWASHDPAVARGERPRFVAGRDLNGPLTVGLEMLLPPKGGHDADSAWTRIIVYGDSDFATNRFLDYLGNRDLLLNTVNWLAREERLIAPRPEAKQRGVKQFFVSQAELSEIFLLSVVVQPGLFVLAGIAVFAWRRFRP